MVRTLILSWLALWGAQAAAQEVNPADPDSLVVALQDLGYRAELGTDGLGDPMIMSATSGVDFSIFFYGCTDNRDCEDIRFLVGIDLPTGINSDKIRVWNDNSLIGTAYLDEEDDPFLGYYLVTTGGVKQETFAEALSLWSQSLGTFLEHIGFQQ